MIKVCTHNEWDPLEEIVVGTAIGARNPMPNKDLHAIRYRGRDDILDIPVGEMWDKIINETEEDLEEMVSVLQKLSIIVRRPENIDLARVFSTMDWESDGLYNYCPRDVFLTIGDMIIETPMSFRSRFLEPFAYKKMLVEYMQTGAKWFSAPKPRLQDEMFNAFDKDRLALNELEPVFDAANILKLGKDILYLVSDTGNELGYKWLKSILEPRYRVHPCRGLYTSSHIDTTIVPIRPGLVLVNPDRVKSKSVLPNFFKKWEVVPAPRPVKIHYDGMAQASSWMSLNLLMLSPKLAIVEKTQMPVIKTLEERGIEVIPLTLRHSRPLGGGFHCVTLDIRRKGQLEDYSNL